MSEYTLRDPVMEDAPAGMTNEEAWVYLSGAESMRNEAMGVIEQVEAEHDHVRDELNRVYNRLRDLVPDGWHGTPTTEDLVGAVERLVHDLRGRREAVRGPRTWPLDGTEPPRDAMWEDGVGDRLVFSGVGWSWSRIGGDEVNSRPTSWTRESMGAEGDMLTEVVDG